MWDVTNETRYAASGSWGRDKDGAHEWNVAVKGTFRILVDGSTQPVEEQLEPLLLPEYAGEYGASSLRYDADLIGAKPTTDVVLNGTAYAPGARASTEFPIALSVGPIRKVLRVRGNRSRESGLLGRTISAPEPVTTVPILYEKAYGGYDKSDPDPRRHRIDARNPVGCGIAGSVGEPLPNFEYPDGSLVKAGPAGFGAIDAHWSPRRELAGTYDEAWRKNRLPRLPEDWDPRSRLCAPADQRAPAHLKGGEIVELVNLTPNGRLRFLLPRVELSFATWFGGRSVGHSGHLDTVVIDADQSRVIMVWATSLKCHTDCDYLDETVVAEIALT